MLNRADRRRKIKRHEIVFDSPIYVPLSAHEAVISKSNNAELPITEQLKIMTRLNEFIEELDDNRLSVYGYKQLLISNYMFAIIANALAAQDSTGQIREYGQKLTDNATSMNRFGKGYLKTGMFKPNKKQVHLMCDCMGFGADLLAIASGYVVHEAAKRANADAVISEHRAMMGKEK